MAGNHRGAGGIQPIESIEAVRIFVGFGNTFYWSNSASLHMLAPHRAMWLEDLTIQFLRTSSCSHHSVAQNLLPLTRLLEGLASLLSAAAGT